MPTLDHIRAAAEADFASLLKNLDDQHKAILRDALKQYGRVQDIPDSVWLGMQHNIEDQTTIAILLLLMTADDWTTEELSRQGVTSDALTEQQLAGYSLDAARQSQAMAQQTIDTIRSRLARKIEDQRLTGEGAVGEATDGGVDSALDDVFTPARAETIATDQTTQGISGGQMGARDRIGGGDGATTADGQSVTIELIWRTERDLLTCPRCAPLEGQPEEVWGLVFPDGPGPDAHPNCRCELEIKTSSPETDNDKPSGTDGWHDASGFPGLFPDV